MTSPVLVHYVDEGEADAPVLVLSSSLGTTHRVWDGQVPGLTARLRVVRYDHRGHGGSPVPRGPYTIEDLGTDLIALLDRLDIARAHICGLSLGGMTAMWAAANASARVDRLALLSTSAHLGPPEVWAERAAAVRAGGMAAVTESVLARWFTPEFAAQSPEVVQRIRDMLLSTPVDGYAACCAAVELMDLRQQLRDIQAPTLVVAGTHDPTPLEHAEQIAAAIPDAKLVILDDVAHMVAVQRPDDVTAILADFFAQQDGTAS
jgi:3-oxoadipate enol-lactonase